MTRHLVRFAQVPYLSPNGQTEFASRGEEVELDDADAKRLTELGAVVPVGTDISPSTDDRPWADVLQEAADRRYDVVRP